MPASGCRPGRARRPRARRRTSPEPRARRSPPTRGARRAGVPDEEAPGDGPPSPTPALPTRSRSPPISRSRPPIPRGASRGRTRRPWRRPRAARGDAARAAPTTAARCAARLGRARPAGPPGQSSASSCFAAVFLVGTGARPRDRRHLVQERRLRQRLLDPPRRPGRPLPAAASSSLSSSCWPTSGSPAASRRRPARAGERVRGLMGAPRRGGPLQRPRAPRSRTDPFGGPPARPRRPAPAATSPASGPSDRRSRPRTSPTSRPLAIGGLVVVAVLAALGTAGALAGSWETVLLWQNRVPVRADRGERRSSTRSSGATSPSTSSSCPFLRLVQALVGGLLVGALIVAGGPLPRRRRTGRRLPDAGPGPPRRPGRPLPADRRGRLPARQAGARVQHPRRRDRRQLHRPGRPVLRLRRPHDRRRARRRAPRRRRVHPLDLAARGGRRRLVRPLDAPRRASTRR